MPYGFARVLLTVMIIAARRRYEHAAGQAISPRLHMLSFDLFDLFICMTRVAFATLTMYIERSLRGGERSLRFFHPLTRCASSTGAARRNQDYSNTVPSAIKHWVP